MLFAFPSKMIDRSILWNITRNTALRDCILIGFGSLLIAIGSKIYVPLVPVPVTLETLAVLFIGMTYGLRLGVLAVLTYLAFGMAGFPFFAIQMN